MANTLQLYFPQIGARQQILDEINSKENLKTLYETWKEEQKEYFLDICTGACFFQMIPRVLQTRVRF